MDCWVKSIIWVGHLVINVALNRWVHHLMWRQQLLNLGTIYSGLLGVFLLDCGPALVLPWFA